MPKNQNKMVNFNNEATVGRPAVDVERILILQRRNDLIDAIEAYHLVDGRGAQAETSVIRSRLYSLYLQIEGMLFRKYSNKKLKAAYEEFLDQLQSEDIKELFKAFEFISRFLDSIRLTMIDTRVSYDKSNVEADNAHDGSS